MSGLHCNRAAEVVEALAARKGPQTLDPNQRACLIGGIASMTLQAQELMLAGMIPPPAAAVIFSKAAALLSLLGLSRDEQRSIFQAAAADINEVERSS